MFSFVGNRNGRKVIRWGKYLLAALFIIVLSTGVSLGIYALVAKRWNPMVVVLGLGAGVFVSLAVFLLSYLTPLQRLPMVK